jgi:hypothetical protein
MFQTPDFPLAQLMTSDATTPKAHAATATIRTRIIHYLGSQTIASIDETSFAIPASIAGVMRNVWGTRAKFY